METESLYFKRAVCKHTNLRSSKSAQSLLMISLEARDLVSVCTILRYITATLAVEKAESASVRVRVARSVTIAAYLRLQSANGTTWVHSFCDFVSSKAEDTLAVESAGAADTASPAKLSAELAKAMCALPVTKAALFDALSGIKADAHAKPKAVSVRMLWHVFRCFIDACLNAGMFRDVIRCSNQYSITVPSARSCAQHAAACPGNCHFIVAMNVFSTYVSTGTTST